jgi:putative hemolysin
VTIGVLLFGVFAVALAAACALADGALLAPTAEVQPTDGTDPFDRERAHRALALGRVLAQLAAGMAIAEATGAAIAPTRGRVATAVVLALAVVALVDGAARAIGHALGAPTVGRLRPFIRSIERLLAPPLALAHAVDAALLRALPPGGDVEEERELSTERFLQVVAAEADVSSGEEAIMHGVFSLGDTEVREVMVPRVDIVGIDRETPWADVLARVRSSEHARFPVYAETLDEVIGILYAKDLLAAAVEGVEPEGGWQSIVRPATFIPTSKTIDAQLRDFQTARRHIAIVIDEFGGTAGLVTIEDVLEEIVGEIRDEYDDEEPAIEQEELRKFWVAGTVTVDQLAELLGHDFEVEDVTTVGGLAYHLFGHVPRAGEAIVRDGFRIVVERVRRRRVERVYFERLEPAASRAGE